MNLKVTHVEVWSAEMDDEPGALATALESLASRGANLDCVIARRMPDKPGKGILFFNPAHDTEFAAKTDEGWLHQARRVATLKIEGPDEPGAGARIAKAIGDVGVSMRGLTAATVGNRFVCYAGFDGIADANKAENALHMLSRETRWSGWNRIFHRRSEPLPTESL